MAFKDIDQRVIKSFAVGEHRCHELRWIVSLEPRRLISLNSKAVLWALQKPKGRSSSMPNQQGS